MDTCSYTLLHRHFVRCTTDFIHFLEVMCGFVRNQISFAMNYVAYSINSEYGKVLQIRQFSFQIIIFRLLGIISLVDHNFLKPTEAGQIGLVSKLACDSLARPPSNSMSMAWPGPLPHGLYNVLGNSGGIG